MLKYLQKVRVTSGSYEGMEGIILFTVTPEECDIAQMSPVGTYHAITIQKLKEQTLPEAVIVREYGEESLRERALDAVMNKIYPKILKKENIIPVAAGNITEVKSTDPIELTLEVEVFPEIEIDTKKLDTIKVKRTPVKVDEKEIDTEITAIKTRFTHFHEAGSHSTDGADTSHQAVEMGDRVTVTAQGYDKKGGEAIQETHVPSYPLVIGSGSFIPGFEEKLIGSKVGDEVGFDITFPAEYHSDEFKGRKVHFVANIEKVEKPHTPEFTPEFIKDLRGVETDMAGFREIIRKEVTAKKEQETRNKDEKFTLFAIRLILGVISISSPKRNFAPFAHFKELRFDINNGRTLCVECHYKTDTYGYKSIKYGV